ncbi:MAG TPA: thiamine phosphate synthase, partial [Candidatus Saccharimonadales bacterium]|nr:thiamine phosphate synthase [Candidatus Saccharimonadales bacterium]
MTGSARRTRAGLSLPRLYPITDRRIAGGLGHPAIVERLAAGGARLVQVREKELEDRILVEQVRRCLRIPGITLVVNDRTDVALACGAAGVHLGDEDLPVEAARALLGPAA